MIASRNSNLIDGERRKNEIEMFLAESLHSPWPELSLKVAMQ